MFLQVSVHGRGGTAPPATRPRRTVGKRAVGILLKCCLVTGRNEVVAKIIFFTPVCHSVHGGGVSASVHAGIPSPEQTPPAASRLRHTVNERPVRILLECILVLIATYYQFQMLQQTSGFG